MTKKIVRLTEADVHRIVENTVYRIITENQEDELSMAGIGGALANAGKSMWSGAKKMVKPIVQGSQQFGQSVKQGYNQGEIKNIQSKIQQKNAELDKLQQRLTQLQGNTQPQGNTQQ